MTQQEIKEWLEWGLSEGILKFDEGFYSIAPTSSDFYIVASHFEEADYYLIDSTMQIALQEEIKKKGWSVEIYQTHGIALCAIIRPAIVTRSEAADTILEAMMLAFRKAWEATHA